MYEFPFGAGQQLNLNWIINEIITLHKQLDPDYELPNFDTAFPYMNLNTLNLDWILRELKAIKDLAPTEDAQLLKMVANALIANTYDAETSYNVDDIVYRDEEKRLYKCRVATTGGSWDSNYWAEIKVGEELTALFNKFDYMYEDPAAVSFDGAVTGKFVSYPDGIVYDNVNYQVLRHVILKQGETIDVTTYAAPTVAPISLEIHTNVIEPLAHGNNSIETFTYTAKNDCQITICTNTVNPYSATITGNITKIADELNNLNGAINAITPLDTTPTSGSTKGITSNAVYNAISKLEQTQINIADSTHNSTLTGTRYERGGLYYFDLQLTLNSNVAHGAVAFQTSNLPTQTTKCNTLTYSGKWLLVVSIINSGMTVRVYNQTDTAAFPSGNSVNFGSISFII